MRGASRKPTAPSSTVAGSTRAACISARRPGPRGRGEAAQPGERERAVLVDERDDVGDRRERDQVEVPREARGGPEQRLRELVDDTGAAELRERVVGRAGRDDGTVGQLVAGAVVVGDDHLEPGGLRLCDLVDCGDPAVDRQDEAAPFRGQARERLACDAVALLEAARQVPVDLGAELAQTSGRPARSRRSRRRRSRRGRRCAVPPRSRRGSGRTPPACRRAGMGRARAARRRGTPPPASASSYPRRTSTLAVVSLTPSACASAAACSRVAGLDRPGGLEHGQRRYAAASDGTSRPPSARGGKPCP